jgi:hypothetical protein
MGEVHAVVDRSGIEVGLIELDFRRRRGPDPVPRPRPGARRQGPWRLAVRPDAGARLAAGCPRLRVNTCSLDHPAALKAYLKAGFRAYDRAFESFPDPRLSGLLPLETAPQIPLIEHLGD